MVHLIGVKVLLLWKKYRDDAFNVFGNVCFTSLTSVYDHEKNTSSPTKTVAVGLRDEIRDNGSTSTQI